MIIKENTNKKVGSAFDVAKILLAILETEDEIDRDKEHFWVMALNTKNVIIYIDLVSLGILDSSLVHPREVFRQAIKRGAKSIIAGHNHPSNDPSPSGNDISITEKLKCAGDVLGISVLDHVIIGNNGAHVSMKEKGYF